jgi:hypothetical protein
MTNIIIVVVMKRGLHCGHKNILTGTSSLLLYFAELFILFAFKGDIWTMFAGKQPLANVRILYLCPHEILSYFKRFYERSHIK